MRPLDSTPRAPRQQRSRQTVERLLEVGEALLLETGAAAYSMPELARRAGVNRATAYAYFPSKYALFSALAGRHMDRFLAQMARAWQPAPAEGWPAAMRALVEFCAERYEAVPAARLLLLGGAITPEIDTAHHQANNRRVAARIRDCFEQRLAQPVLSGEPDAYLIAIELVIAIFSVSQRLHGRLTADCVREAQRAAASYLGSRFDARG